MRQCCQSNPLMKSCWVGTAATLGLWSVVLVRNGQKLQFSNEPFCPGSGRWQGPGRVFSVGPEPRPRCLPGQNVLEMGRVSGQCQGTAAWPVCQGLIAAEGFKQSRGKWVTVGRGDRQTLPEQGSLWGCHLHSRDTKASSVSSAKLLVLFPCSPTPICAPCGLPVPLDTPGSTKHPAPTRSPLYV